MEKIWNSLKSYSLTIGSFKSAKTTGNKTTEYTQTIDIRLWLILAALGLWNINTLVNLLTSL
jgi:hypothetical protein